MVLSSSLRTSGEASGVTHHVDVTDEATGVFLMSRAVVPAMVERRSGSMINMSSAIAEVGLARRISYAAALYLASDDSAFVVGSGLAIDGGLSGGKA